MPSEAYQQFLKSMNIGFEQWHDGIGYDLEALQRLSAEERVHIEEMLIKNLEQAGDWRDVEALAALGTTSALAVVDKARFHNKARVRNRALRIVLHMQDAGETSEEKMSELEDQYVQAVAQGYHAMAEDMPTMRVKKALLESARAADNEFRGSAAALLLYLCGQAPERFDWSQRPFFLLFSDDDPAVRQSAWEELRKRSGI